MTSRSRAATVAVAGVALVALLAASCAGEGFEPPADASPQAMDCTLGAYDGGSFVDLPQGATAELVLGFQGFVWVDLALQASVAPPVDAIAKVAVAMTIDGRAPVSTSLSTRFVAGGTAPLRILMSPADVAKLKQRTAAIDLRADVAGWRCFASGVLGLRDDDPCIHVDDAKGCTGGLPP